MNRLAKRFMSASKDLAAKARIYEEVGVSGYWTITIDNELDIYCLVDGRRARCAFILCDDKTGNDQPVPLRQQQRKQR